MKKESNVYKFNCDRAQIGNVKTMAVQMPSQSQNLQCQSCFFYSFAMQNELLNFHLSFFIIGSICIFGNDFCRTGIFFKRLILDQHLLNLSSKHWPECESSRKLPRRLFISPFLIVMNSFFLVLATNQNCNQSQATTTSTNHPNSYQC